MLWTVAIVLLVLWGLAMVSATTMGGLIHLLLAAVLVIVLVQVLHGRRRVQDP